MIMVVAIVTMAMIVPAKVTVIMTAMSVAVACNVLQVFRIVTHTSVFVAGLELGEAVFLREITLAGIFVRS
jgi:hypothetical protein